jgi:putative peptidoglycan lipid II flippase
MVKKFFKIFGREIVGLHEAAYLLAFSAFLSQVLALFRDRLLASSFGANVNLDLYYSAFRIPDLIFATLGGIVSASVILPFFMEKNSDHSEAKDFFDSVFYFYFLSIVLVSFVVGIFAPYILKIFFPSFFGTENFSLLVLMTRILLLSPIFLGLSNLFSTVSQAYRRFFIYALSPILYNIGIMVGIVFIYPRFGVLGLVLGVVLGAFLHFFIQVPFAVEKGFWPRFRTPKIIFSSFATLKKIILISIPRTITVSSNEITELFLISFASFLLPGSISVFNFAFNLQSVPFAIVGISYSMAAFPTLAEHFNGGDHESFVKEMSTSSRHIIFWSIPISILFIVLRAQIVRVILGAGRFNWDDTRLTAAALAIFTVSLISQNMTHLFVRSYYSRGKTKVPLIMNMISSVIMIVSSYFLVKIFNNSNFFKDFMESLFKVSNIPGTVVLMLPFGYSIGSIVNMVLHWFDFHKEFKSYSARVSKTFFHVFGSSLIMGSVTYYCLNIFDDLFNVQTTFGIFLQGFTSGLIGIASGIFILVILKNSELSEVWKTLHHKIWKADVVGPDPTLN